MDDEYYLLYNEEETEKVKEIKLELHKSLRKNRERAKAVHKPMEAANIISLIDRKNELKEKKNNEKNTTHIIEEKKSPLNSEKNKNKGTEKNIKTNKSFKDNKHTKSSEKNEKKNGVESKKRKNTNDNIPSLKKLKPLINSNKENDKRSKVQPIEKSDKKSTILNEAHVSASHVSISSNSSSSSSSSINYLENDKKNDHLPDKNAPSSDAARTQKYNNYPNKKNIYQNRPTTKDEMNAKEINVPNNNGIKHFKNFKINYQNLTTNEKEYYNYMIKRLNIKYDSKKHDFFSNGAFNENFAKIIQENTGKFNYLGYLEYACLYLLEWLTPTKEEKLLKLKSLLKLETVVKSIFPKSEMEIFGSFVTGLSIPGGDVDVCFMNIDGEDIDSLYIIAYALIKLNMNNNLKIVKDAKVKILKYTDRESGVQIDICINQNSSRETTDFILKKIKEYVYLRPLVILLKFFLNSRNLNETYIGGIGSFLLCCMVLHFLQMHPSTFDQYFYNNTQLVKLLVEFFDFYSIEYKLNDNCSVIRGLGHIMPKYLRTDFEEIDHLCFENPIDTSLDIGKNTYKIKYILYLFSYNFCNLITLIHKLKNKKNLFIKKKEHKNNSDHNIFVEDSKIYPNSLYPLFFCYFYNPDNIVFTKRFKANFPNVDWNISKYDFAFSNSEKNNIFEMFCDDVSNVLDPSYKLDNINLFSNIANIFSFSINVHNNIFNYT